MLNVITTLMYQRYFLYDQCYYHDSLYMLNVIATLFLYMLNVITTLFLYMLNVIATITLMYLLRFILLVYFSIRISVKKRKELITPPNST